jgi:hypothetical protein
MRGVSVNAFAPQKRHRFRTDNKAAAKRPQSRKRSHSHLSALIFHLASIALG